MPVSTVSSKGQITLPAALRRRLRIEPHDRVTVEIGDDEIVVKRAPDLFSFKGFLGKGLPPAEEKRRMMKAVADHVLGKSD
jgi:AbrB family looped-hinge helix DNA binding protein